MTVTAFRITNFRSIVDSGWIQLSPDGVTVLVGQNESGKTSVLQALYCALSGAAITPDDRRVGTPDPAVYLRARINLAEFDFDEFDESDVVAFCSFVNSNPLVDIKCEWPQKNGTSAMTSILVNADAYEKTQAKLRNDKKLIKLLMPQAKPPSESESSSPSESTAAGDPLGPSEAADLIHGYIPGATLFNAESGLLPNTVDIDEKGKPAGNGATAAGNFLTIAEISLPALLSGDGRFRQNVLNKANKRVSDDFSSFWSQLIGVDSKLTLQCAFEHYGSSNSEKAGKPYLEFWISDGNTQLYPKQRSLGVRWFVSFYLQLRANEKNNSQRIFLLDEPGANLHAKAQGDVLKLIDRIRKDLPIVYSTHSPQMIEYEKLYRIRAVQRDGTQEDSPTVMIDGHHLGAASSDTLSPILAAMGSDMSHQTVIKKSRNVLLEEISGFYYLKAFWKLSARKETIHFIAATGVNKLPLLANMFLGWGLDFIVAVDDDKQGREVFNQLKKDLCGDDEKLAKDRLIKLPGATSIEEIFSSLDFKRHVLRDEAIVIENGNAEYMKAQHVSKPVAALQFWLKVEDGSIQSKDLEKETTTRIESVTSALTAMLAKRPA
ncbi:MAG: AAA family ATPase [Pseudomonadota bacterium]